MDDRSSQVITGRAKPRGRFPHFVRAGSFVYVSGTSSRRPDDSIEGATVDASGEVVLDIAAQTAAVITNIEAILQSAGANLGDLVQITSYLVSMADFAAYNDVYSTFFDESGPTRTTVEVRQLPHPHLLIEMQAVAFVPENSTQEMEKK